MKGSKMILRQSAPWQAVSWQAVSLAAIAVLCGMACAQTTQSTVESDTADPSAPAGESPRRVGFDVDDTLLFSSPAFEHARSKEGVEPYSDEFWTIVNGSDEGRSRVKKKTLEILQAHRDAGAEIYAVTARHPHGGDVLRGFLERTFEIPGDHVYFETEGKAGRLRALGIEVFYGDADTDISAAIEAGAHPVRILRSTESTYRKNYNPGRYDEEIVEGSEE